MAVETGTVVALRNLQRRWMLGLQPWNFSHGFLARMPEHLVVTRAGDVGWSDWGTPEAIERSLAAIGVVPLRRGRVDAA